MSRGEPTSEKLVQDYTSTLYPKRYSGTGFLYHARIVTEMLDGVKLKDGKYSDKILDCGCGTGFVSQLYPSFDIVGIDISDGMLSGNPHKWIKAPAEAIPFPDNHFDWVICRSLLHHLDDPVIGLKEMFRVLKPGGTFVCWDPNHNILYETIRHIFQETERFSHLHHSFNDEELFTLITTAITSDIPPIMQEGKPYSMFGGFKIIEKKYIGYLGYPLLGFPDIINFKIPIGIGKVIMKIDEFINKTWFKKLSWSLMVKAVK